MGNSFIGQYYLLFPNQYWILENDKIDVSSLLVAGSFGMLVLAVAVIISIVRHQKRMREKQNELQMQKLNHRQQLLEAEIQVTEKEREKIAKNIHDDLSSKLNFINQNIAIIRDNPEDEELVNEMLNNSTELLVTVIEATKGIIYDLMPPALVKLGYLKATVELCSMINATRRLHIECIYDKQNLRFSPKIELQLYRITQEVLNNILKHCKATKLILKIEVQASLMITIFHNGEGITNEKVMFLSQTGNGIGLRSIQSRVNTLNASIRYKDENNEPKLFIEVPDIRKEIINEH